MNNQASRSAGGSRGGHRRFAYLTREDVAVLDELEATQGKAAAKEFERLVRAQYSSEQHFRDAETVETDLGVDLGHVLGERSARFAHGTGGGHRRRPGPPRS